MANTNNTGTIAAETEIDLISKTLNDKGISMNALADQTGIPYSSIRRSLKSDRPLNLIEIRKIAAALNVQPSALLPADLSRDAA
jgi:lambda repressor-like predicted transcriptional regulator